MTDQDRPTYHAAMSFPAPDANPSVPHWACTVHAGGTQQHMATVYVSTEKGGDLPLVVRDSVEDVVAGENAIVFEPGFDRQKLNDWSWSRLDLGAAKVRAYSGLQNPRLEEGIRTEYKAPALTPMGQQAA